MYHARDRAGLRPWRSILLGAVSLTALFFCLAIGSARADCTEGGTSCLPGSGYTFDDIWNCGAISFGEDCFYDGVKAIGSATFRMWGWGSASYSGMGNTTVCVQGGSQFAGCGQNLARACALASCNAQVSINMALWVENAPGTHTIHGHGQS